MDIKKTDTEVFVECDACHEKQLTNKQNCRKCDQKFSFDIYNIPSKNRIDQNMVVPEFELASKQDATGCKIPAEYCYDCLKTKGFVVSLILIAIASFFTILAVFPTLFGEDINPFKLIGFIIQWVLISGFVLLMGILAWFCLREYCQKNSDTYKNDWYVAVFAGCTIAIIVTMIASVITIGPSYEQMIAPVDWQIDWPWFGVLAGFISGCIVCIVAKAMTSDSFNDVSP